MSHPISIYDFPGQAPAVTELRAAMLRIADATAHTTAAKEIADPARPGWSWKNLYTLWRKWEASSRNDLTLLDRRRHTRLQKQNTHTGLPHEFLQWAGGQILANQRKSRPAWRAIIRRWQQWRTTANPELRIPGYQDPPAPGRTGIPHGWSYKNIITYAQPPKAELAIARIGTVAAKPHLPHIPGTRQGVRFLEYIFGDDVFHDRKIILPGHLQPMRLLQLGILDYATATYLKFGLRPDLPREDGTRERLKRRDFLFLIAHTLIEYGYPADYPMHIIVERATATLTRAEAQFLYDISGGLIRVGYTSMEGQFVLAFQEAASGNPQGKSPLESWHNLFQNEMASLPGQVGKDRDHSPASLYGSDREAIALNKAALLLTPDQRKTLRTPYPTFHDAHRQTLDAVTRINHRHDHHLEGFEHVMQWRLPGITMDWQPEAALATLDHDLLNRVEYLPRLESPAERLQRLSHGLRLIKPHPGALIRLYEDSHTTAKITAGQARITIENRAYTFGPHDPLDQLPQGTEITLHHAPLDPHYALITHNGEYLGIWQRQLVRRNDPDALATAIRRKQTFLNHSMSTVRGKMLEKLEEHDRRLNHNIQTLQDNGVLPSETLTSLATPLQPPPNAIAEAMQQATQTLATAPKRIADDTAAARESLRRRAAQLQSQDQK